MAAVNFEPLSLYLYLQDMKTVGFQNKPGSCKNVNVHLLRTETGLSIRQTDSLSTVLTEKPEI
jgi:hypothetical protein